MAWIKARAKEMSSWSGASLIALGGLIILGGPFVNILAWAAVIWGIVSSCKKDEFMLGFRLFFIGILASAVIGAGVYVMKLRSDNAILKANAIKMESAIADQKTLIENQQKDFQEILNANTKMNELVSVLKKDLEDLDKRFNKKNRDVGKLAIAKTKSIERITNGASALATRCIEIASGSPLTEAEKNATKKSEINSECPSIANPNYIPY